MSTAVAAPPAATTSLSVDRSHSPRQYAIVSSANQSPPNTASAQDASKSRRPDSASASASKPASRNNGSPGESASRTSPSSASKSTVPPTIKVKQEPGSPTIQSARHRPKRLDLTSSNKAARAPQTARPSAPLTSRDSAGLGIQDMGIACLSPGFQTNDPGMREQLQRSLDVRDQQRQIIEARQKGTRPSAASHEHDSASRTQDTTLFGVETRAAPATSRRKGPPPGLTINAPSASQFANDRVVQSAPLNQTFTGLRTEHPFSRHIQHGPSHLGQNSHIHHVPAQQTANRLPPLSDVFSRDHLEPNPRAFPSSHSPAHSSHSNVPPPIPSPSFPPPHHHQHHHAQHQHHPPPLSGRSHEFRSADEAMQGLSGGRDELLPKVVHYGGVQPPTPPSPMPHSQGRHTVSSGAPHPPHSSGGELSRPEMIGRTASMNGRRRGRDEYERDNGSPPSIGRPDIKRTTFTVRGDRADKDRDDDWRSGLSSAEKREEFLRLCERAWDLFHS